VWRDAAQSNQPVPGLFAPRAPGLAARSLSICFFGGGGSTNIFKHPRLTGGDWAGWLDYAETEEEDGAGGKMTLIDYEWFGAFPTELRMEHYKATYEASTDPPPCEPRSCDCPPPVRDAMTLYPPLNVPPH
jgi:hypothetical protein